MSQNQSLKNLFSKETSFASLMKHRIYNVLLYASKYDAFMLEEDGRIDEQIFFEYTSLNLRYPPRFTLVSSEAEANSHLSSGIFDLIISMPSGESINPFRWAKEVKQFYPEMPFVVLTPFSRSVSSHIANEDQSCVDYVFSWLGNPDILLAITKMLEDKMNADEDINAVGVQAILLVEDSIRFYSSLLPHIYKSVFTQSMAFKTEALNEHEQMLRLRGRPKILFARTYEEAMAIYSKYQLNMLGVLTDVSFSKEGKKCKDAGIQLSKAIRSKDPYIPIIIESSEESNREPSIELSTHFINKNSNTFPQEINDSISDLFGFSDFRFYNPTKGEYEASAKNLKHLQEIIFTVSSESLIYHVSRNDISRWLYSRAMFPLAEFLKNIHLGDEKAQDADEIRKTIFEAIVEYRTMKNRGVIAVFERDRFDRYSNFARIGEGSLGGKGRGLAFVDAMIKRNEVFENFERTRIRIPKTVVICTDLFTEFMDINNLYPTALSDVGDQEILNAFLAGSLPKTLTADLISFINATKSPIAVRSSSLLEDSHYQPFAGIYSTYMVPYNAESLTITLTMLTEAIKGVYASVFYQSSKAYMTATKNLIDEEKMAIVLQEAIGNSHKDRFYPSFSGVARSLNYYPIEAEKAEEGIVNIAVGLGKYVVDGGLTLRFSPYYPTKILQLSNETYALRETQKELLALDLSKEYFKPELDDGFNLKKINVQDLYSDGTLKYIASTYNQQTELLSDNLFSEGRKVITFANILKHNVFPLADTIKNLLKISSQEMGRPIEIEFAANIDYERKQLLFYPLQIRPIVENKEFLHEDLSHTKNQNLILKSHNVLGHGILKGIKDIIYVKSSSFNPAKTMEIKSEIDLINKKLIQENRQYILVGPGRWGSTDPWLGIPVKWSNISQAVVIIESGLSNYRIEPSQGTHFFQNLSSFGVCYFNINPYINEGYFDEEYLNRQVSLDETEYIRHIQFNNDLIVKTDARRSIGIILKAETNNQNE